MHEALMHSGCEHELKGDAFKHHELKHLRCKHGLRHSWFITMDIVEIQNFKALQRQCTYALKVLGLWTKLKFKTQKYFKDDGLMHWWIQNYVCNWNSRLMSQYH
jgi:hypothetical protein